MQNDLADVLLEHGADINHPQGAGNGQLPIHGCLANGCPEAAEHLAKCGARLNLEAAAGVGHLGGVRNYELVELLTASGAVIDPAWLSERDRGIPLDKMTASEQRMAKALRFGGT